MTEIYILMRHIHYENTDILGVFATEELAKQKLKDHIDLENGELSDDEMQFNEMNLTVYIEKYEVEEEL